MKKRFLSVVLSLILVLGLGVMVNAYDGEPDPTTPPCIGEFEPIVPQHGGEPEPDGP